MPSEQVRMTSDVGSQTSNLRPQTSGLSLRAQTLCLETGSASCLQDSSMLLGTDPAALRIWLIRP
jgi:hypothetical protein